MKKALMALVGIVVFLALPLILNDRSRAALVGPQLDETEYVEVSFDNREEGIRLAGMLFLPKTAGPHPAVVVIHGSGPSRRDSRWYLSTAAHLQAHGIAVLLPDKRGCEQSEGDWVGASFDQLAADAHSAVEFVREQSIFAPTVVGLLGMSQGGWIAPIVAGDSEDVDFVVSMSGAAVSTDEQLVYEEGNNISRYTYGFIARLLAPLSASRLQRMDHIAAFMGFDPIPYWQNVAEPVFFAFGGNDTNVPVQASIERLEEHGLGHFKIAVYPDGGHAIRDPQTNSVSEAYLSDLVDFIRAVEAADPGSKPGQARGAGSSSQLLPERNPELPHLRAQGVGVDAE